MSRLAEQLDISYTTLQRIETNKISPSVSLLSEIAHHLGVTIHDFLKSEPASFRLIKPGDVPVVGSGKLRLQVLLPRGVIDERLSINYIEIQPGDLTEIQTRHGFDFFYILEGEGILRHGGKEYEISGGDAIYYDASVPHSWKALTTSKFLAVNIRKP